MNRIKRVINFFALLGLFVVPFNFAFSASTNYRYTGQELDKETDLYYYGQRYYNPDTGRFTQKDPVLKDGSIDANFLNKATKEELYEFLSNPQKLNEYSYVLNNPVKYVDPTGESEVWAWALNPTLTKTQIQAWKFLSNSYLKSRGYNISAAFLERSLRLNLGFNLDLNINKKNDNLGVINKIQWSGDYQTFIQKRIENANKDGLTSFYFEGGEGTANPNIYLTFTEGDLHYSIHRASVFINGKKLENGQWELNVQLKDKYNFELKDKKEYRENFDASVAANAGLLSQSTGAISNYNINIQFQDYHN